MSLEQIAPEALRLSVRERALLAESLWESIGDPYQLPVPNDEADAIALALRRDAEIDDGLVTPLSHEELMRRLRNEN